MIWLIGCKGMLGTEVSRQLTESNFSWIGTDRDVDITNYDELNKFALRYNTGYKGEKINWIINCSAYTAVDKAEEDTEICKKLNEDGPRNIARLAREIGAKLIHISTDYVFDGTGKVPYTEDMERKPLGVYGATKAAGEEAVENSMSTYYILRTAWLYGFDGKNFVYTMTNAMNTRESVKVVSDQKGSPTCAVNLAAVMIKIILSHTNATSIIGKGSPLPYGIYHVTDEGETTWFEFTQKIYKLGKKYKRISNLNCQINPCTTEEYPTAAKRPAYSVLSKEKIQKMLKIKLPKWESSLEKFIKSEKFQIR